MAKKTLDDDFSSMDDLDFDFGDEMDSGIDQTTPTPKKRGVVTEVAVGAVKGAVDVAKSPEFIKSTLRKSLPSSYEDIADAAEATTSTLYDLYDHAGNELKPRIGSITRKLDSFVPENQATLKKLTKKLMDLTGERENTSFGTNENQEEQTVTSTLSTIFEQQKQYTQIADKKAMIRDTIDKNRFQVSNAALNSIQRSTGTLAGYTTTITQAYQKKSLELQLRSYLAQKQQLEMTKRFFDIFKEQNEGIIRNTSMPEYQKITMSERYKEEMKKDVTHLLYGEDSFLKRGLNNAKNAAKDYLTGVGSMLGDVDEGLGSIIENAKTVEELNEMMVEMGFPPMSKAQFAGSVAGAQGVEWLRDKASEHIRKHLSKDKKLTESLAKGARGVLNPAGYIAEMRASESWENKIGDYETSKGKIYRGIDSFLDFFKSNTPNKTFDIKDRSSDLNQVSMGFTNKAMLSLTDVIPGYLAAIQREIRISHTKDPSTQLMEYNYEKRAFVKSKQMTDYYRDKLQKKASGSFSRYAIRDAVANFAGGTPLSPEQELELKIFMSRIARIPDMEFSPKNIVNSEAFDKLSPATQDFVSAKFQQILDSEDKEFKITEMTRDLVKIKRNFPSFEKELGNIIDQGDGEHLEKIGLVKKNNYGGFERDEKAFAEFLETYGINEYPSDINLKQGIKEMDASELLSTVHDRFKPKFGSKKTKTQEKRSQAKKFNPAKSLEGVSKTRLYDWEYKEGEGDGGQHSGPMAQDVRRNLGDEVAPNGKAIDIASMNGALMASIQELNKRVSMKEEPKDTRTILKDIRLNTQATAQLLIELNDMARSFTNGSFTVQGLNFDVESMKKRAKGYISDKLQGLKSLGKKTTSLLDRLTSVAVSRIEDTAIENLTPEDLLNIRTVQEGAKQQTEIGDYCRRILKIYPVYANADTSDEAIDAARKRPPRDFRKSAEERTALENLSVVSLNIGKAGYGVLKNAYRIGRFAGGITIDKILTPGMKRGYDFVRLALSKIEKATRVRSKYSAEDLMLIRAAIRRSKSRNKQVAEEAKAILERFPDYMKIDTSEKAIEKARRDGVDGTEIPYTERTVLSYLKDILGNSSDIGMKVGGYVINTLLPGAVERLRAAWKVIGGTASRILNRIRDLYVEGISSPAIQAKLLKLGHYRDQATGKILETMDDVMACKGNIIDAYGNVVVTVENLKKGLYDIDGKLLKSTAINMVHGFRDRLIGGAHQLFKGVKNALSNTGITFGDSKYLKEGYDVWVDIRDILLGQKNKVLKRLKLKASEERKKAAPVSPVMHTSGDDDTPGDDNVLRDSGQPGQSGQKSGSLLGSAINYVTGEEGKAKVTEKIAEAKEKGKSFFGGLRDRLRRKPSQGDFIGPAPEFVGPSLPEISGPPRPENLGQGTLASIKNAKGLKGKFGAAGMLARGMLGKLGSGAMAAANTLTTASKQVGEQTGQPGQPGQPNLIDRLKNRAKKAFIPASQREKGDSDGDGVQDGSVEDRKNKLEALKESRKKAAPTVDLTNRYAGKGFDILDMLSGKLTALFALATSGIGSIFKFTGGLLSKIPGVGAIIKGASTATTAAASAVKGQLARGGITAIAKQGVGMLGRAIFLKAVPAVASMALSAASVGLSAITTAISTPLLPLAIGAMAMYGLYRLYKYAVRNNTNDYEQFRMRQYGLSGGDTSQYNHRMFMLEAYLQDGRTGYENGQAVILEKNVKAEELAEIFKIDKDDNETAQNFAVWYRNRFLPFYLRHMTALYQADPARKKLEDIPSLTEEARIKYLEQAYFADGPYNETTSPIKGLDDLSSDSVLVKESIDILLKNTQIDLKKKQSKKPNLPVQKKDEAAKSGDNVAKSIEADKKREMEAKANEAKQATAQNKTPAGSFGGPMMDASLEGEMEARQSKLEPKETSATGSVPLAGGELLTGDQGMQYVNLGKNANLSGMHPQTLKLFLAMAEEYGTLTGKKIFVDSAHRSTERQRQLRQQLGSRAAPPGRSLHEFGLALDISRSDAAALEELGLMKKYGFTRPLGGEPWHIEPAGIQKNIALAKTDSDERDTMVMESVNRGGGGYGTIANAKLYSRNPSMALSLLQAPGKAVDEKKLAKSANDEKYITTAQTPQDSTSKALPAEEVIAAKQSGGSGSSAAAGGQGSSLVPETEAEEKPISGSLGAKSSQSKREVETAIKDAATEAGVDYNLLLGMAKIESGLNPNAKSNTSSATGLYGFVKSTWDEKLGQYGKKYGLPPNASPTDPRASSLMAAENIKSIQKSLLPLKTDLTFADVYLGHFTGPQGARKLLQARPDEAAAAILPKAASANAPIFYDKQGNPRTVSEVYNLISEKVRKNVPGVTPGKMPEEKATQEKTETKPSEKSQAPQAREMITSSPNSGVYVDKRGSSLIARERREAGEQFTGPNLGKIESSLDKSIGIQQDQLTVLKDILENVKTEKVAETLAAILSKFSTEKSSPAEQLREADNRNMGRSGPTPRSSLDLSRKVA